jgi:YD repeat-containing protein
LIISPAATAGEQPSNVRSYVFDERDLLFTATRGGLTAQFRRLAAHADIAERNQIPNSRDISTVSGAYDLNWNLKRITDAADNNGDGQPEVTTYLYDGFDRRISTIDAAGNQSFVNYDPAGHVIRVSRYGPVGGPTPPTNRAATFVQPLSLTSFRQPLLSRIEYKHDELGRIFERQRLLFDYQADGVQYGRAPRLSDGPLGESDDGMVVTRYEYDRNSRRTVLVEDDLSTFQWVYDGANRLIERIDPGMNRVQYSYDDNSNVVKIVEVDVTPPDDVRTGKAPDLREVFTTINVYDSLNRLIRTTDNIGQTTRHHYDSRNNLILTSDAQHSSNPADLILDPLGLFSSAEDASASHADRTRMNTDATDQRGLIRANPPNPRSSAFYSSVLINRLGNTVEFFYDGLNRKIAEVRHLRVGGQGKNPIDTSNPANPDGLIVMDYDYDANSRLVAMADDGSTAGDQNTTVGFIELINPKGNVTRYAYDDLNRRTHEIFDDGTVKTYRYDADDHLTRTTDQNGSIINHTYDGIHRLVRRDITRAISETAHPAGGFKEPGLNWRIISTTEQQFDYDGLSRMTRSFDNNEPDDLSDDATVAFAYDSLGRRLEEVQNGRVVSSRWAGDNNRTGLVYPNGRELEFSFDSLDRINRIGDQQPIVDYSYIGPDRVLERAYRNGARLTYLNDARTQDIGYDGLKRPVIHRHLRDILSASEVAAPPPDVRQVSDLPKAVLGSFGASPLMFGRSPDEEGSLPPESRRLSAHRAAEPRSISDNLDQLTLVAGFGYGYDRENNKLLEQPLHLPLPPSEIPPDKHELIVMAGRATYSALTRRVVEARSAFEQLIARYPDTPNVHYAYGVFLLHDNPDAALAEFRRELQISPKHVLARLQMAFEYFNRGDYAAGLLLAEQAAQLAPNWFAPRIALGQLLLETGAVARAVQELETGVKLAPESPTARFVLARAYFRAGR